MFWHFLMLFLGVVYLIGGTIRIVGKERPLSFTGLNLFLSGFGVVLIAVSVKLLL